MISVEQAAMVEEYMAFIKNKAFPCIAAKAAMEKQNIKCMVADHMGCPKDDQEILQFLYAFTDEYRKSEGLYHSAAILFKGPEMPDEELFDILFWQRLQSLVKLDSVNYGYDSRVSSNPNSPNFSFSIKEEAFYLIGLHPASNREARQFKYPAIVFNPHAQFEQLRGNGKYENIKNAVRKRDIALSGSINPMLVDFGEASEAAQYTGQQKGTDWQCPLKINHANEHHSAA